MIQNLLHHLRAIDVRGLLGRARRHRSGGPEQPLRFYEASHARMNFILSVLLIRCVGLHLQQFRIARIKTELLRVDDLHS